MGVTSCCNLLQEWEPGPKGPVAFRHHGLWEWRPLEWGLSTWGAGLVLAPVFVLSRDSNGWKGLSSSVGSFLHSPSPAMQPALASSNFIPGQSSAFTIR